MLPAWLPRSCSRFCCASRGSCSLPGTRLRRQVARPSPAVPFQSHFSPRSPLPFRPPFIAGPRKIGPNCLWPGRPPLGVGLARDSSPLHPPRLATPDHPRRTTNNSRHATRLLPPLLVGEGWSLPRKRSAGEGLRVEVPPFSSIASATPTPLGPIRRSSPSPGGEADSGVLGRNAVRGPPPLHHPTDEPPHPNHLLKPTKNTTPNQPQEFFRKNSYAHETPQFPIPSPSPSGLTPLPSSLAPSSLSPPPIMATPSPHGPLA